LRTFCLQQQRKRLAVFVDKENVGFRALPAALEKSRELGMVVKTWVYCCSTHYEVVKSMNLKGEIVPVEPSVEAKEFRRGPTDDAMLRGVKEFVKAEWNTISADTICLVTNDKGISLEATKHIKSKATFKVINLLDRSKMEHNTSWTYVSYKKMFDGVYIYGENRKSRPVFEADEVEEKLWEYFRNANYVSNEDEIRMRNEVGGVSVSHPAMFKFSAYNNLDLDWELSRIERVSILMNFCKSNVPKHDPKTHIFIKTKHKNGSRNKPPGNVQEWLLQKTSDKKAFLENFLGKLGYCHKEFSMKEMQDFISRKHDRAIPKVRENENGTLSELIDALYEDINNADLESNRCFWRQKEVRPLSSQKQTLFF